MKVGELYVIWNDVNDKLYVGITTVGYKRRFRQHLRSSHRGHHNYKLYRAIEKYGRDKFHIDCLLSGVSEDRLPYFEIECIKHFNSQKYGYNITAGGDGSLSPTEESRKKRSEAMKGRKFDEETRRKISEALKGKPRPYARKPCPEERKRKISEALKGRKHTPEECRKISEAQKGRISPKRGIPLTLEQRIKISKTKAQHPMTLEHRLKLSEINKGRTSWSKGKTLRKEVCPICGREISWTLIGRHIRSRHEGVKYGGKPKLKEMWM